MILSFCLFLYQSNGLRPYFRSIWEIWRAETDRWSGFTAVDRFLFVLLTRTRAGAALERRSAVTYCNGDDDCGMVCTYCMEPCWNWEPCPILPIWGNDGEDCINDWPPLMMIGVEPVLGIIDDPFSWICGRFRVCGCPWPPSCWNWSGGRPNCCCWYWPCCWIWIGGRMICCGCCWDCCSSWAPTGAGRAGVGCWHWIGSSIIGCCACGVTTLCRECDRDRRRRREHGLTLRQEDIVEHELESMIWMTGRQRRDRRGRHARIVRRREIDGYPGSYMGGGGPMIESWFWLG